MRRLGGLLAILGLASGVAAGQANPDQDTMKIQRLSPDAFPNLPASVRKDLIHRGCTIPQPPSWIESKNVVSGHFHSADETDWAVLCSIDLITTLLVYRGGHAGSVDSLGTDLDANYLEGDGDGTIGFIRAISAVDSAFIREMYEAFGGPIPPPIDHDGLDEYTGKASVVHYWYDGKWLTLQGMD